MRGASLYSRLYGMLYRRLYSALNTTRSTKMSQPKHRHKAFVPTEFAPTPAQIEAVKKVVLPQGGPDNLALFRWDWTKPKTGKKKKKQEKKPQFPGYWMQAGPKDDRVVVQFVDGDTAGPYSIKVWEHEWSKFTQLESEGDVFEITYKNFKKAKYWTIVEVREGEDLGWYTVKPADFVQPVPKLKGGKTYPILIDAWTMLNHGKLLSADEVQGLREKKTSKKKKKRYYFIQRFYTIMYTSTYTSMRIASCTEGCINIFPAVHTQSPP